MEKRSIPGDDEFEFTRETKWRTYDGSEIPVKDLEDSHILNLLGYIGRSVTNYHKQIEDLSDDLSNEYNAWMLDLKQSHLDKNLTILNVINEEIELRDLDRSKADGEHSLPFKKDGVWMEWKKGSPLPTQVPSSIDFISPVEDRVKNLKRESNGKV